MGRIALIIPTMGRMEDLDACLLSIAREADYRVLSQIIVVDDGSMPPVSVPKKLAAIPVLLLRNSQRCGAASSRNLAMSALAEDVDAVGFIDDDARLCPGWLDVAHRELTRDRGAITGPVYRFDQGLVSRARQLRYDRRYARLLPGQVVPFLAGGNSLVWRYLLEGANGFPDVAVMSDQLLLRRLEAQGHKCHFVPEMYILHRNSKGLRIAIREAWRAGKLDDSSLKSSPLVRLSKGVREAVTGKDLPAGLLNVALDCVYLCGRAATRSRPDGIQPIGEGLQSGRNFVRRESESESQ
ncbi:MAG: glycosyltransferase [Terracidiphilus sp.]